VGKTEGWWQGLNADGTGFEVGSGVHRSSSARSGRGLPTRDDHARFSILIRGTPKGIVSVTAGLMMYKAAMNLKEVVSGLEEGEGQPVPVTPL
jgi:hypothetical protein